MLSGVHDGREMDKRESEDNNHILDGNSKTLKCCICVTFFLDTTCIAHIRPDLYCHLCNSKMEGEL